MDQIFKDLNLRGVLYLMTIDNNRIIQINRSWDMRHDLFVYEILERIHLDNISIFQKLGWNRDSIIVNFESTKTQIKEEEARGILLDLFFNGYLTGEYDKYRPERFAY